MTALWRLRKVLQKYFGFLDRMKQSLYLKQPELIVTQLHFLMVEIISALSVRTLLETLN